jgi:tol-pal system protein YbgF
MTMPSMSLRPIIAAFAFLAAAGIAADGAGAQSAQEAPIQLAQLFGQQRGNDSELVARLGQLESQIRQLTGMVEELQHRNTQLEQQLKRVQQDTDFRLQEMTPPGRPPAQRGQSGNAAQPPPATLPPVASRQAPPVVVPDQQPPAAPAGRRGDVFDPTTAPDAPGAPRPLGTTPSGPGGEQSQRPPGAPLDLGSLSGPGGPAQPGPPPGLPPQGQQPVGPQAVLAPSGSAKDEYDLAYGAILRRDYDLAVDGFRTFLTHHATSREPEAQRLLPDAHYWFGEAQFQRKQYNDAAEVFLKISTDYPNAVKAPDALLRLGQSLAALGERETACASLGHVLTKYPKASTNVKRAVEQEQKRARC